MSEFKWEGAKTGPDENERVAALHSVGILDTPPSECFDRLTSVLSGVLDVPITLVSFVDSNRQWCKSQLGMGRRCETLRSESFCSHAVLPGAPDVFVVLDASKDPRFVNSTLVTSPPFVRFYAGASIKMTHKGRVCKIGTVCVMGREPRMTFGVKDKHLLLDMAAIVADEIELYRGWASRISEENQRYITSTAHDLKTPLTVFRRATTLFKDHLRQRERKLKASNIADLAEVIEQAKMASDMMTETVCNAVDSARARWSHCKRLGEPAGAPPFRAISRNMNCRAEHAANDFENSENGDEYEHVNVAELVDVAHRLHHRESIHLEVEIDPNVPKAVLGDKLRMQRALSNLVANAYKHATRATSGTAPGTPPKQAENTSAVLVRHLLIRARLVTPGAQARFDEELSVDEMFASALQPRERKLKLEPERSCPAVGDADCGEGGSSLGLCANDVANNNLAASNHWLRLEVHDDGPGVPSNLESRLFHDAFVPPAAFNDPLAVGNPGADFVDRQGTGLGLFIVNLCVKEMGGVVGFRSSPEAGSNGAEGGSDGSGDEPGSGPSGRTVLAGAARATQTCAAPPDPALGGTVFWFDVPLQPPTRAASTRDSSSAAALPTSLSSASTCSTFAVGKASEVKPKSHLVCSASSSGENIEEEEQVGALRSIDILNTPPSECFDRLTSMLSRVLDVPIALVSFVDSERQWCKSNLGFGDSFETNLNNSFCSQTLLAGGPDVFVVHDASTDPRFKDSTLVTGPPLLRFYAAAPIKMMHGGRVYKLGTVCVVDKEPRMAFNVKSKQLLLDIAAIVADEIELYRGWANHIMEDNLRYITCTAHDLKTPLTALQLATTFFQDYFKQLQEDMADAAATAAAMPTAASTEKSPIKSLAAGASTLTLTDKVALSAVAVTASDPSTASSTMGDGLLGSSGGKRQSGNSIKTVSGDDLGTSRHLKDSESLSTDAKNHRSASDTFAIPLKAGNRQQRAPKLRRRRRSCNNGDMLEVVEQAEMACDMMADTVCNAVDSARARWSKRKLPGEATGAPRDRSALASSDGDSEGLWLGDDGEEVTVADLIRSAHRLNHRHHGEDIQVEVDIKPEVPAIVIGDNLRMQRALSNLVTNACKHATKVDAVKVTSPEQGLSAEGTEPTKPPTGHVQITARLVTTPKVEWLRIEVHDDGPGLPEDLEPRVFREAFVHVPKQTSFNDCSSNRSYSSCATFADKQDAACATFADKQGTGLGLFIVNLCVKAMGGVVGFRSRTMAPSAEGIAPGSKTLGDGPTFGKAVLAGAARAKRNSARPPEPALSGSVFWFDVPLQRVKTASTEDNGDDNGSVQSAGSWKSSGHGSDRGGFHDKTSALSSPLADDSWCSATEHDWFTRGVAIRAAAAAVAAAAEKNTKNVAVAAGSKVRVAVANGAVRAASSRKPQAASSDGCQSASGALSCDRSTSSDAAECATECDTSAMASSCIASSSKLGTDMTNSTSSSECEANSNSGVNDQLVSVPRCGGEKRSEGRLLVVDDSVMVQKILVKGLERLNFVVDVAKNGREGLDKMIKSPFRAVLMDFLMPVLDGISATSMFRRWELSEGLRACGDHLRARQCIIGISANADPTDLEAAHAAGMDHFVPKPVKVAEIVEYIMRHTNDPGVTLVTVREGVGAIKAAAKDVASGAADATMALVSATKEKAEPPFVAAAVLLPAPEAGEFARFAGASRAEGAANGKILTCSGSGEELVDAPMTRAARKKKQMEESANVALTLKQHSHILDLLPDLIVGIDGNGMISFVSKSVTRKLQYSVEVLLSSSIFDVVTPQTRLVLMTLLQGYGFVPSAAKRLAAQRDAKLGQGAAASAGVDHEGAAEKREPQFDEVAGPGSSQRLHSLAAEDAQATRKPSPPSGAVSCSAASATLSSSSDGDWSSAECPESALGPVGWRLKQKQYSAVVSAGATTDEGVSLSCKQLLHAAGRSVSSSASSSAEGNAEIGATSKSGGQQQRELQTDDASLSQGHLQRENETVSSFSDPTVWNLCLVRKDRTTLWCEASCSQNAQSDDEDSDNSDTPSDRCEVVLSMRPMHDGKPVPSTFVLVSAMERPACGRQDEHRAKKAKQVVEEDERATAGAAALAPSLSRRTKKPAKRSGAGVQAAKQQPSGSPTEGHDRKKQRVNDKMEKLGNVSNANGTTVVAPTLIT